MTCSHYHAGFAARPHVLRWDAKAFGTGAPYGSFLAQVLPLATANHDRVIVEALLDAAATVSYNAAVHVDTAELAAVERVVAEIAERVKADDYAVNGEYGALSGAAIVVATDAHMLTTCG